MRNSISATTSCDLGSSGCLKISCGGHASCKGTGFVAMPFKSCGDVDGKIKDDWKGSIASAELVHCYVVNVCKGHNDCKTADNTPVGIFAQYHEHRSHTVNLKHTQAAFMDYILAAEGQQNTNDFRSLIADKMAIEYVASHPSSLDYSSKRAWLLWRGTNRISEFVSLAPYQLALLDGFLQGHDFAHQCERMLQWFDQNTAPAEVLSAVQAWFELGIIRSISQSE